MPKRGMDAACSLASAFRILLPILLWKCVSLESCSRCVGSVLHVFFSLNFLSFSISHLCLGCPWLDLSSMLGLPAAVGCWVASRLNGDDDSQCPVWKMRFRCWVFEGICLTVRYYSRPLRIIASLGLRYYQDGTLGEYWASQDRLYVAIFAFSLLLRSPKSCIFLAVTSWIM